MKDILDKIKLESKIINKKDLYILFDKLLNKTKKSFNKLEIEQYYKCDMDENYENYINGNYDALIKVFDNFSKDWAYTIKDNIEFKRLHLINKPITQYINYEMYFYMINEKAGEKIKCLDFDKSGIRYEEVSDFIIFDDNELIINCHNKGEYLKSYYCNDKVMIRKLLKEYETLYSKAIDYKKIVNLDKNLITKMKENGLI